MAERQYWLVKAEPDDFTMEELIARESKKVRWEGIRNYQARNFMRDSMKIGDGVFFYQSRTNPLGILGTMEVASEPYPDPSQYDPNSKYFDEKATEDNPRWFNVDFKYVQKFDEVVSRDRMKEAAGLEDMKVLQKGMRLSIMPVTEQEWKIVHELAGADLK